jgi:WD40 repeat protein
MAFQYGIVGNRRRRWNYAHLGKIYLNLKNQLKIIKIIFFTYSDDFSCQTIVNCHGSVNSICFDPNESVIIVAAHDQVKVYEMEEYHLVQTNSGHKDSIR